MKDSRFINYLNSRLDESTNGELPEIWKAFIMQCKRGNMDAIKFYFKVKELDPEIKLKRQMLEILRTFNEIMCKTDVDSDTRALLIELNNDLGQLDKTQSDNTKCKPILEKISGKFKQVKNLGDNIKGAWPYIKAVYNVLQPFAKTHGIDLPQLPPNI
jgi:hypothetical protein